MEIATRRATLADAEAIMEVARQTFYDTFTGTCTEDDMQSFLEDYFNLEQIQAELQNENDFYYLTLEEGRAVGYMRFMEDYESFPKMEQWKSLELKRIYVLKEFQGTGVAQQLMDCILQYAKENNYQVICLGVWEYNMRAQNFYYKYGFENSGYTHDFPVGSTPQTDCWFWKFL